MGQDFLDIQYRCFIENVNILFPVDFKCCLAAALTVGKPAHNLDLHKKRNGAPFIEK